MMQLCIVIDMQQYAKTSMVAEKEKSVIAFDSLKNKHHFKVILCKLKICAGTFSTWKISMSNLINCRKTCLPESQQYSAH